MGGARDRAVLVTGGGGFIGSHLTEALIREGARVIVLDDFSTGRRANLEHLGGAFELIEADIRDLDACRAACRGVEWVFHQAALGSVPRSMADPATSLAVNVQGTANVLAAAREHRVARVVYASSSSVYGDSEELPRREGREGRPLSPYAASKRMTEQLAEVFSACYGMETVGLRYFNVYGPRQSPEGPYAAVVPRFFRAALAGESLQIFGDGRQSRDFTFVGDAVRANLLAAAAPDEASGGAYNIGSGRRTRVDELAASIGAALEVEPRIEHLPPRPGDVRHAYADLTLAERHLGYTPEVSLEVGLRRCRRHYESAFGEEGE